MTTWNCTECNSEVSETYCPKCNKNKLGHKKFVHKFMTEPRIPNDSDWTCKDCNINIYGGKKFCVKCHKDKDGNASEYRNTNYTGYQNRDNGYQNRDSGYQNRDRGSNNFRGRGDDRRRNWKCRVCREYIPFTFLFCNKCEPTISKWKCFKCSNFNKETTTYCEQCKISKEGRDINGIKIFGKYTKEEQDKDFGFYLSGEAFPSQVKSTPTGLECKVCSKICLKGEVCFLCMAKKGMTYVKPTPPVSLLETVKEEVAIENKDHHEDLVDTRIPFMDAVIFDQWI